MKKRKEVLNEDEMRRAITRMTYEVLERNHGHENMAIVGIRTRGAVIAERIAQRIEELEGVKIPLGFLDVSGYRDDVTSLERKQTLHLNQLDFSVTGKHVFICDDVLMTGRTIRATMDALVDYGRPSKISLVTLIDRGHRELPIRADIVGKNIPTSREEAVQVRIKNCDPEDGVYIIQSLKN